MNLLFSVPGGSEIVLLLYVAILIFEIYYLVTLQNLFRAIEPENRLLSPGTVWVVLVPLLGSLFHFIVVFLLSGSIKNEAASRGIRLNEKRPGLATGLLMLVSLCFAYVPALRLPAIALFLVFQVIFLLKMKEYQTLFTTAYTRE